MGKLVLRRGTANLLLLVGVLLGALGAMMPWVSTPGVEQVPTAAGAGASQPAAQGLAAVLTGVLAAGWLLSLTLPTRGKQVLGVLLVLAGAGLAVVAFTPADELVASLPASTLAPDPQVSNWRWLCLPAGVLAALGAVATLVGAPRWPRAADRFRREAPTHQVAADDDAIDVWKAMDAGVDPTADADPPSGKGDAGHRDGTQ